MTLPAWIEWQDRSGNCVARFDTRNTIEAAFRLHQRGLIDRGLVLVQFDREGFPIDPNP